ncbi:MAG: hypothetical protein EOO88_38520 [Pedobacter sp.]|nr:MAG: hypothetical protein EOO88_38520 [Pedobacter sp.]
MENQENEMEQEEIINPEQFQVGRTPEEEKTQEQDDAEYTEDEVEFADGEGTQLEEEFDAPEQEDAEEDAP